MEKNSKILIGVVVFLSIIIIYLLISGVSQKQVISSDSNVIQSEVAKEDFMKARIPAELTNEQKAELKAGVDVHQPTNLTFNIVGGSFYFTPNEIKAKQGDKVKIIFTNAGGTHNLAFVDFNELATKTIQTGESDTIEFLADKKGTFEFYCSVGKGYHRTMGQIGVLIVE